MKRSEVNRLQSEALDLFGRFGLALPPWGTWRPADWERAGDAALEIKTRMLGWDVTDYGKGDFGRLGALLFTLRNGPAGGSGQPYCEKVLVLREGQALPLHFHWSKIEDIINRGGGELVLRIWDSSEDGSPADTDVKLIVDGGLLMDVRVGEALKLTPGQSVTVTPGIYHDLKAEGGDVLVGEVSSVNDDNADNRFLEPVARFASIEEDEEILYCLCNEYP